MRPHLIFICKNYIRSKAPVIIFLVLDTWLYDFFFFLIYYNVFFPRLRFKDCLPNLFMLFTFSFPFLCVGWEWRMVHTESGVRRKKWASWLPADFFHSFFFLLTFPDYKCNKASLKKNWQVGEKSNEEEKKITQRQYC